MLLLLFVALALGQNTNACPGNPALGWCDCAGPNSGVTLQQFFFQPNPPVPGQNLTGEAECVLKKVLTHSSLKRLRDGPGQLQDCCHWRLDSSHSYDCSSACVCVVFSEETIFQVNYMGIPLIDQTVDLCSALQEAHNAFPSIPACPGCRSEILFLCF